MNIKRITIIQIVITLILATSLYFVFNYTISFGILLGSGTGYFSFYSMFNRINNLHDEEIPNMGKIVKRNRNFRYLVLILILVISGFLPQVFNIVAVCFSILLNKISILIDLILSKK